MPGPPGHDAVDPFGLRRRLTKPLVTAVQGITFTIGIEIALAGDIVVAASDTAVLPARAQAGARAARRGDGPLRAARRVGQRDVPPAAGRRVRCRRGATGSGWCRRSSSPACSASRAVELARELLQCSPLALRHTIANARLALDEDEPTAIDAIPAMSKAVHGDGRLPRGDRVVHRTTPGTVHGTLT